MSWKPRYMPAFLKSYVILGVLRSTYGFTNRREKERRKEGRKERRRGGREEGTEERKKRKELAGMEHCKREIDQNQLKYQTQANVNFPLLCFN